MKKRRRRELKRRFYRFPESLRHDPWPAIEHRIDAEDMLQRISGLQAACLRMYFILRVPLKELATDLGITVDQARWQVRSALTHIV